MDKDLPVVMGHLGVLVAFQSIMAQKGGKKVLVRFRRTEKQCSLTEQSKAKVLKVED